MNRRRSHPRRRAGFGLVEIMVSMSIGLVMLGALGYVFVGSKAMNQNQTETVRIQDSARIAIDVLGRAARQSGYKLNPDNFSGNPVEWVDGDGDGHTALPDTLTLRHDPSWTADPANPQNLLSGTESNCEGAPVVAQPSDVSGGGKAMNTNLVAYRFVVRDGRLVCHADPDPALVTGGVVVADNVENMQLTFGILSALGEQIEKYTSDPVGDEATRVAAIRVSLLIRGPSPNMVPGGRQSVTFNGEDKVYSDGFLRRVYTSTFTLRNGMRK